MPAPLTVSVDAAAIDAIFAKVDQCHAPGAAVGIAVEGRPVYRKGFGLANMELPTVLTPSMRMRIGSATKHFAALAYLLLCEDGKAGLDDTVRKHIPEAHPSVDGVTMRQLMGHISGLRDVYDLSMQFSGPGRPIPTADMLAYYRDIADVNAAPGTAWNYNNGGYVLLSVAVERLSDQSLEDILSERIFAPVGMTDTLLRRMDTDFVPNSATLHNLDAEGRFTRDYMGMAIAGEGGMVSTVDDMLRWLAHMDAPKVGSAETWAAMTTPQRLNNGYSTGYGLGLMIGDYRGARTIHHSGGVMGGNSQMIKVVDAKLDIAIMVNRADVISVLLANEIIDACVSGLEPRPQPSDDDAPITGVYYSRKTSTLVRLLDQGGAQMLSIDGMTLPARRTADGRIVPALDGFDYAVQPPASASDPARLSSFGTEEDLASVAPSPDASVASLAGHYACASIDVSVEITAADGGLMVTSGRFGQARFTLEAVGEGLWRTVPVSQSVLGGTLEANADGQGFLLTNALTRRLAFKRIA